MKAGGHEEALGSGGTAAARFGWLTHSAHGPDDCDAHEDHEDDDVDVDVPPRTPDVAAAEDAGSGEG